MSRLPTEARSAFLLPLMLVHGATSLLHFVHNAVYLNDYPNLPLWLTAWDVIETWLLVATVGALGYLIYSRMSRVAGLLLIATYALSGLAGLDHYVVAPISAHTVAMNLTILLESASALVLLTCVAQCAFRAAALQARPQG